MYQNFDIIIIIIIILTNWLNFLDIPLEGNTSFYFIFFFLFWPNAKLPAARWQQNRIIKSLWSYKKMINRSDIKEKYT